MKKLYFAYGANMNQSSMARRCPAATNPRPFVLQDWRLKFYSHATVEPSPGDSVWGILWDITPQCERLLDSFEGFPVYYTKQYQQQNKQKFFFYEMATFREGTPSKCYVDDIRAVYRYFGQPFDHLVQDIDAERIYTY